MTTSGADFDSWLAGKATAAGARLVTSTVATGLVRDGSGRVGRGAHRPDGADLRARVVIACDGVNSFLAKEAGLLPRASPATTPSGSRRSSTCRPRSSTSGSASGPRGCGHGDARLHQRRSPAAASSTPTPTRSASASWSVAPRPGRSKIRPEELVADLKAHPSSPRYLRGPTCASTPRT